MTSTSAIGAQPHRTDSVRHLRQTAQLGLKVAEALERLVNAAAAGRPFAADSTPASILDRSNGCVVPSLLITTNGACSTRSKVVNRAPQPAH